MKKINIVLPLLLFTFAMSSALAEPVVVVVNSSNTQSISLTDIRNIYLDKTTNWENGGKIVVYNLPADDEAADLFASKALGMSARDAATAESNRVITNAARNPQQTKREALVATIVARTPNAIGYLAKKKIVGKSGIRVLLTLE
ncbi:MAG: hypothetical protein WAW75_01020 [Gallionella sp.]